MEVKERKPKASLVMHGIREERNCTAGCRVVANGEVCVTLPTETEASIYSPQRGH